MDKKVGINPTTEKGNKAMLCSLFYLYIFSMSDADNESRQFIIDYSHIIW